MPARRALVLLAFLGPLVAAQAPLRVAHTDGYAPYEFAGPDGRPQGYLIDLFRLWSDKTGREIELVELPWAECKRQVLSGEVDVLTAMTPTPDRRREFAFAREIARAESRVYTHRSLAAPERLADLGGLLVGVVAGDNAEAIVAREAPLAHVETYPGYRELAAAAVAGEVRVAVGTSAVLYHHLSDLGGLGGFVISDFVVNADPMAPAVARGRDDLVRELEAGFALITEVERERIARLWVPYSLEPHRVPWPVVMAWAAITGGLVALVLLGVGLWNRQLRRRVAAAVAAREELEERLRHSQKMDAIGRLAGGVAHDFNNVLTAIMGHAELIGIHRQDPEAVARSAEAITGSAERAAGVVRQLLSFARREPATRREVDLHQLVAETQVLLEGTLGRQVELVTDLAARRHRVIGDADLLQSALVNLVVNARDAMADGGRVTIATAERALDAAAAHDRQPGMAPGAYCVLRVSDAGPGVPLELRERIFDPFFTTKDIGHGTGLGLAAVYGTARGHGGTVVVGDAEGGGACFEMYLPLAAADA